jgi:hypothetical protein
MASGDPWALGAIKAGIRAIALDPHSPASGLIGQLALKESPDDLPPAVLSSLQRAIAAGVRSPEVLRACSEVALAQGAPNIAQDCSRMALALAHDKTFHLLRLSRLAYRAADSLAGQDAFLRAVDAADETEARDELSWHFQWFLTPVEYATWQSDTVADFGNWVRDRLASRDIRDGREPGARLAEHFTRLEHTMAHFRLRLPRHVRKAGGLVGASPDLSVDKRQEETDAVRYSCEPGSVTAPPFRFYARWQLAIDDRGAVWMRFGQPAKRVSASPECVPNPPGRQPTGHVREAWLYEIDGAPLVLHFESERFDGSAAATRLVGGVLGTYLCDVDSYRCSLTERAKTMPGGVPPEKLNDVRLQDQEYINIATTKDDNSVRGESNLRTVGSYHRLWDSRNGSPIGLITWAIRLEDLASVDLGQSRATQIRFAVRRWSRATEEWSDTTLTRRLSLPDTASGRRYLTGFFTLPGGEDVTAWSLVATQSDRRRGRAWADEAAPLSRGVLQLSDLVLGSESQGLQWDAGGERIPLAPLGTVARARPVTLFYQMRNDGASRELRTTVAILRGAGADTLPALQLRFETAVPAGVTPVVREIDVASLSSGRYRLRVELHDARGVLVATRVTPLLVD